MIQMVLNSPFLTRDLEQALRGIGGGRTQEVA